MRVSSLALICVSGLVVFSNAALASPTRFNFCEKQAARAVVGEFRDRFYLPNGKRQRVVEIVSCESLISRRGRPYVRCNVGASTGDGAGDISFEVALSGDCRIAYAAYITGEE